MSNIPIHPPDRCPSSLAPPLVNPLPELIHTPSGLAILELQGTINLPSKDHEANISGQEIIDNGESQETLIGRLVFPDYNATQGSESTAWMKRVYLYVGKHQRLTGEVKKLPKAIAIIRKKRIKAAEGSVENVTGSVEGEVEELEVVEIVKWKILFSQRPEPVGTWNGEV